MRYLLVAMVAAVATGAAVGCDLCGCYTPQLETMPAMERTGGSWYAAVSEQFTYYGTLQLGGKEVPNPVGQYLASSITQIVGGYTFNGRFALQLNLPVVYRDFKRPEGFAIDRGTESGLGDISILLKTVAFRYSSGARRDFRTDEKNPVAIDREPDFTFSAVLLTGLKLPTGGTSRLEEEFHEIDVPGAPKSGIHGHDLALGTGSYDGIFGEENSLRYKRYFLDTTVQFTLRGDGAHKMHMANDLTWDGGPGYYVIRRQDTVFGVQLDVSGERKGKDRFEGMKMDDTGITSVFLGPRLVLSRGRWSAEADVGIPVVIQNTDFQAVSDYRVRAALSYQF